MAEAIDPLQSRIARLLGEDDVLFAADISPSNPAASPQQTQFSGNPFEDILSRTVDALQGVSRTEATANQLIERYAQGQADLQEVMVATSKMSIMVQFAVTTINLAVTTFKEITQMQV